MSINPSHFGPGNGSVRAAGAGFAPSGLGARPSRPGQLAPGLLEQMAGGIDPQAISELAHVSAAALLDRVHHSEDPAVVERVLTLVDREGVDVIAELWSSSEPDSLPGILWRLYMLRTWMHRHRDSIARLWRVGEPVATSASAIAGVDQAPTEDDIARLADSILSGAFTGDFAVALERASAFTDVVATGLRVEAHKLVVAANNGAAAESAVTDEGALRTKAARLMHTAGNLFATAKDFQHGANLWRRGRLE
ncbi:hypothetical protein BLEM_1232 [Bifidobacterium lemurum]|uniref:Thymidine phosphorylase n=2 Tax=Bifidobacterium lemurum TaxID=1603886 RepID=A0A261FSJ8_9BIFI|nr:hypothetical protein BLEM_1232 [Bifidobacterium lemurum]